MSVEPNKTKVLVTGSSGYLATHCVQQLLQNGYQVRGTVRSLKNEKKILPLKNLEYANQRLELVEADLEDENSWIEAVKNCDYVLHTASPFPIVADDSIVKTAVDGTLAVLKACSKEKSVKKVVLTSSCAAINEGHEDEDRIFDENDWTVETSPKVLAYPRSKTAAEKAAWEFVKNIPETGNRFILTCINPTLIVGPLLMDTQGTSITIIRRFLNNEMPAVPALNLALVDVRDVAKAHILAMTNPKADNERFLVTYQPSYWFRDISRVLAAEFRSQGYWLPTFQVPYFVLRFYSIFDPQARAILERVNREVKFNNSKAKNVLGIEFRNPDTSLVEMAYTMIERGILPKKFGYKGKQ
uniref:3-beta hydroxysteroid dehydrogenase/isomerase domain-containing protein n=1 Tax=Panagrolaimus sp. JU765 TaxID=591449 RepID=A0AC34QG70_9BILA